MNRKKAFTLAEVLITLGIIGIVAAMTMPTLIANHKKKELITKIQYVYSVVSQVLVKSQAENGEIREWSFGDTVSTENVKVSVEKYIAPYIEHIGEGSSTNNTYYLVLKNGITLTFQFDQNVIGGPPSVIYILPSFKGNTKAWYDASKDYSKTDFFLTVMPVYNKLKFFNWGGETREGIINEPNYGCKKEIPKNRRYSCGALIQSDGWQIKEDYPW